MHSYKVTFKLNGIIKVDMVKAIDFASVEYGISCQYKDLCDIISIEKVK